MGNSTSQIPYSAYPIFISDILEEFELSTRSLDMRIVIIRGSKEFSLSLKNIISVSDCDEKVIAKSGFDQLR